MAAVSTNTSPFGFSTALPPLTPEASAINSQRRRLANATLGNLRSETQMLSEEARAQSLFNRERMREDLAAQLRSGMVTAASKGLGMSPMFAGRLRREGARFQQQQESQFEMDLANRLNELQRALFRGELDRDREMLNISAQEAAQRMAAQVALVGQNV